MKAFISYSHYDENYLKQLHKHLAQLQRDNLLTTWTDNEILAGGNIDAGVPEALESSELFLALLSSDYINSNYCYEKEFEMAMNLQKKGGLIIVPIILEPCDWLNTPFKNFKALPKDGKEISSWSNSNTAFLDVIQKLRALIQGNGSETTMKSKQQIPLSRNYKVQKDFDSIQKMDFLEATFLKLKSDLNKYIEELNSLNNIHAKVIAEEKQTFKAILVNRNRINNESVLTITTDKEKAYPRINFNNSGFAISYSLGEENHQQFNHTFQLANDDYDLFWEDWSINAFSYAQSKERLTEREIVEHIWADWLKSVGIEF